MLSLTSVATSHLGLVRKNNQDSGYASPTTLLVADGMGGAAAGDLASAVAVHEIRLDDGPATGEQMLDSLAQTISRANRVISGLIAKNRRLEGMGTTISGVKFDGENYGIVNLGDSRTYLLRAGQLTRLTHDHSFVQTLIDDGQLTEEEAHRHPNRSLILKVLNGMNIFEPDLSLAPAQTGDRILVCSDGLCGFVDDEAIASLLAEPDLNASCTGLLNAALAAGGYDNITIIVADVHAEALPAAAPVMVGSAANLELPDESTQPIEVLPRPDPQASEVARYQPQLRRRGFLRPILIGVLATVLVLAGAGFGFKIFLDSSSRYYLAPFAAPDGDRVGIWYGVPGVSLAWQLRDPADPTQPGATAILVAELTKTDRERILGAKPLAVDGLAQGQAEIGRMHTRWLECLAAKPTPPPAPPAPPAPAGPTPAGPPSAKPMTPTTTLGPVPSVTATPAPTTPTQPSPDAEC